jgi:hypothetical protein
MTDTSFLCHVDHFYELLWEACFVSLGRGSIENIEAFSPKLKRRKNKQQADHRPRRQGRPVLCNAAGLSDQSTRSFKVEALSALSSNESHIHRF